MHLSQPLLTACISGVRFSKVLEFTSAPAFNNSSALSTAPHQIAQYKTLTPMIFVFTSAPTLINALTS